MNKEKRKLLKQKEVDVEAYNVPKDWHTPQWKVMHMVNNWRNYVEDNVKEEWTYFTTQQRIMLSHNFQQIANKEEWD